MPKLGIEIPLGSPPALIPADCSSSEAADPANDNFLGFYHRLDAQALKDWTNVTLFMRGSIGFEVKKSDVTDNLKQFLIIMFGQIWDKKKTWIQDDDYPTVIFANNMLWQVNQSPKTTSLDQFDSWILSQLRAQLTGLADSGGFIEID